MGRWHSCPSLKLPKEAQAGAVDIDELGQFKNEYFIVPVLTKKFLN